MFAAKLYLIAAAFAAAGLASPPTATAGATTAPLPPGLPSATLHTAIDNSAALARASNPACALGGGSPIHGCSRPHPPKMTCADAPCGGGAVNATAAVGLNAGGRGSLRVPLNRRAGTPAGRIRTATSSVTPHGSRSTELASTNVVPNPGFEQGGCGGNTDVICGWKLDSSSGTCGPTGPCTSVAMAQDANAHSGQASVSLLWGTDFSSGSGGVEASTDPAFCAAIGPGAHQASFWVDAGGAYVRMGATFFSGTDCSGTASQDSLGDLASGPGWQQLSGVLVAPAGTQSAGFFIGLSTDQCDYAAGCMVAGNFDDLDVENAVVATPTIKSFTPSSGLPGTMVDISGVNFSGASAVTFNGVTAAFTVDSDTEIHATVPAGATTGSISVTTPNGTATSASPFGVPPTISSFTPTCGPVGGSIDVVGSRFVGGATLVGFSGVPATSVTVDSDSELHAIIPVFATPGPISVSTAGGDAWSSSSFTGSCALPPPAISSLTPTSGPAGTSVDIQGSNFAGATSVNFNGTAASFSVNSDSEIHATVPSGATTGPISVTTSTGTGTASSSFTVSVNAPPQASFTFSCSALTCSFDGSNSVDSDGTITAYSWNFGDGTKGSGETATHTYAQATSYTASLTVTDNAGTTAATSHAVTLIALTARGYKQKGLQSVDLSWTGPSGTSYDVYRNGAAIATTQTTTYTDNINQRGSTTYTYEVCASGRSICSNQATISF